MKKKIEANSSYYRSPVDRLVKESGFSGKLISKEMGITYNRMVALRRAASVSKHDLMLCANSILYLDGLVQKEKGNAKGRKATTAECAASHEATRLIGYTTGVLESIHKDLNSGKMECALERVSALHSLLLATDIY